MLSNGLDFLVTGVQELTSGNSGKLKYGVIHIFAGTLLIMKERLRQEHWTLLFSKIDKLNKKSYESGDFPGVDYRVLIDHLENVLEITITKADKDALEELRKIRNKIEHFEFDISVDSIKSFSGKVLRFTVEFIDENFDSDDFSKSEKSILEEIKETSKQFEAYIESKLKIIFSRAEVEKKYILHCPECHLKSIIQQGDGDFSCEICNQDFSMDDVIDAHMLYELDMDSFSSAKEGYSLPIHSCKECSEEALVPMDRAANKFLCINCADVVSTQHLHHCPLCSDIFYCSPQEAEDGAGGLCASCWDEQMAKD